MRRRHSPLLPFSFLLKTQLPPLIITYFPSLVKLVGRSYVERPIVGDGQSGNHSHSRIVYAQELSEEGHDAPNKQVYPLVLRGPQWSHTELDDRPDGRETGKIGNMEASFLVTIIAVLSEELVGPVVCFYYVLPTCVVVRDQGIGYLAVAC